MIKISNANVVGISTLMAIPTPTQKRIRPHSRLIKIPAFKILGTADLCFRLKPIRPRIRQTFLHFILCAWACPYAKSPAFPHSLHLSLLKHAKIHFHHLHAPIWCSFRPDLPQTMTHV
jgi:hypothetical protein